MVVLPVGAVALSWSESDEVVEGGVAGECGLTVVRDGSKGLSRHLGVGRMTRHGQCFSEIVKRLTLCDGVVGQTEGVTGGRGR